MADPESRLGLRVRASLPVEAKFGRENFAGDPLVKKFIEWAMESLGVKAEIFISWSCPPDVSILTSPSANILVRSERFDILLIEYFHLKNTDPAFIGVLDEVCSGQILRWMAEFFLGFRWPQGTLYALRLRDQLSIKVKPLPPFRDDMLASIDEVRRAAIQCFCLAHELSHLIPSRDESTNLSTPVDGRSLSRHIRREFDGSAIDPDVADRMIGAANERINARILLREIDADLSALELVAVFLAQTFDLDAEAALHATLEAYEAQAYLYALKHSCLLIKRYARAADSNYVFSREDWISSVQIAVRTRCVMRRAGFLLSRWSTPNEKQTAEVINRFVPVIDGMASEGAPFRDSLAARTQQDMERLRLAFMDLPEEDGTDILGSLLEDARNSPGTKLDLFYMLVGMGFPGGTDPFDWIEHLAEREAPRDIRGRTALRLS
jgi:hypothetical protein